MGLHARVATPRGTCGVLTDATRETRRSARSDEPHGPPETHWHAKVPARRSGLMSPHVASRTAGRESPDIRDAGPRTPEPAGNGKADARPDRWARGRRRRTASDPRNQGPGTSGLVGPTGSTS